MKSETVNGLKLSVGPLPAITSLRLWAKLIKQHGGAAASMLDGNSVAGIERLCGSLDVELLEEVRSTFCGVSTVDGKSIDSDAKYNAAFTGKVEAQIDWLRFCLTSEYGDFFERLAEAAQGDGADESDSPNT